MASPTDPSVLTQVFGNDIRKDFAPLYPAWLRLSEKFKAGIATPTEIDELDRLNQIVLGRGPANSNKGRAATKAATRGSFTATANANTDRVDRRLVDIMQRAAAGSPYDVEVFSGRRSGGGQSRHDSGNAVDVVLIDRETGERVPNLGAGGAAFEAYETFARSAREIQEADYPELSEQFRWGGYFGPSGLNRTGADLMHFDLRPGGAMSRGSWEEGLNESGQRAIASLGAGQTYSSQGRVPGTMPDAVRTPNGNALDAATRMAGGTTSQPTTALAMAPTTSPLATGAQSTLAKVAGSLPSDNKVKGDKLARDAGTQLSRMAADPTLGLKPSINTRAGFDQAFANTGIRSTAGFNSAFANTGLRQAISAALPSTGMPVDRVQSPQLANVGSQLPVPGGPPMRPENMGTGGPGVAAQPGSPEMARMAALYAPYGGAQASTAPQAPAGSTLNAPGRNQLSGGNYQVQSGDTASTIASRNNITLNQLLQLNPGISNPNQIYAGESLNVPQAANVNAAPQRNSLNTTNTSMGSSNTIRANVRGAGVQNVTRVAPGKYFNDAGQQVYRQH